MTKLHFDDLRDQFHQGLHINGHPFRFATLGTTGLDNEPQLRMVVIREVTENFVFRFYTDARTEKIKQLKKNNQTSLLFYHQTAFIQVKVSGRATIVTDKTTLQNHWKNLPLHAHKDYSTTAAPGSSIENPEEITFLQDQNHFSIVEITATRMEYLKLNTTQHLKVQFLKTDSEWYGEFLVP